MNALDAYLDAITRHYLQSPDFNGYPLRSVDADQLHVVTALIRDGRIHVVFDGRHPNPHIHALEPDSIEVQLRHLIVDGVENACAYPTKSHLTAVVPRDLHVSMPFRRALALGDPQLTFRFFDLKVLESYRNDPRYNYETDDIQGSIYICGDAYESPDTLERDKVGFQQFGFGYDKALTRRVASVLLCDLAGLTSEHQQIWAAHELTGDFFPHPDFHASVMGRWGEKQSIFQAFVQELKEINTMARLMGREPLFREDFSTSPKPREFGFLIRTTLAEFNSFVHLLDKLMSDNINVGFFGGDIALEIQEQRPDGTVTVTKKGTIQILQDWFNRSVRFPNPGPKDEALATFRRVRRLRQKPAHAINENLFDQKYFQDQRALIIEAYSAVRTIRLLLSNHPLVKGHEVEDWLFNGDIWTY